VFPIFPTSNNVCEHYFFADVFLNVNGVDGTHVHLTSGVNLDPIIGLLKKLLI
jgi:hypothetical protein